MRNNMNLINLGNLRHTDVEKNVKKMTLETIDVKLTKKAHVSTGPDIYNKGVKI